MVLLGRQVQELTVQQDRDLMVREDQVLTVQPDRDPTVQAPARRTPAQGHTVQLRDPAPTVQPDRDLMVQEDRDLMVQHRVSSVLQVQELRRVLAPARGFSVR